MAGYRWLKFVNHLLVCRTIGEPRFTAATGPKIRRIYGEYIIDAETISPASVDAIHLIASCGFIQKCATPGHFQYNTYLTCQDVGRQDPNED